MGETNATSVSFHGPDGCGKSTLATACVNTLQQYNKQVLMIGASSYRDWLSPAIARDFGCNTDLLGATALAPHEKTELYEDIAVACYGVMGRQVSDSTMVIIDSDPYLKRMVWAKTELLDDDKYGNYVRRFEDKMTSRIGETALPRNLVRVDVATGGERYGAVFERVMSRGKISEYDPDSLDEAQIIVDACHAVWDQVKVSNRFQRAKPQLHIVSNENSPSDRLGAQVAALANLLLSDITDLK